MKIEINMTIPVQKLHRAGLGNAIANIIANHATTPNLISGYVSVQGLGVYRGGNHLAIHRVNAANNLAGPRFGNHHRN